MGEHLLSEGGYPQSPSRAGFAQETHIAGLPTLHLDVTAAFDGGQVFAELQDAETGLRLGHATMDIRYHAGGYDHKPFSRGKHL